MKVKVILNGADGFQLQHLKDNGEIKNVRPATAEEYQLYTTLRQHMDISQKSYERAKAAEEALKKLQGQQDALDERVRLAEEAKHRAEMGCKKANALQDEAEAELDEQRKRAEAAEALVLELKAVQPAPASEAIPEGWSAGDGMPDFQHFEAHNGR